jgi:hypothetical protein
MDGLLRGVLGILVGAWLYSELYPILKGSLLTVGALGKLTLPGVLGVNHWVVILPVLGLGLMLVRWLDQRGL